VIDFLVIVVSIFIDCDAGFKRKSNNDIATSFSIRYRCATIIIIRLHHSWFCCTAVEPWSLAGELSLSCARPVADG